MTPNPPIDVRPRTLFNPDMRSANFMVPGLLGVIMQLVTVMLTALSIVREKENGTLEQLLVTPVSKLGADDRQADPLRGVWALSKPHWCSS